MFGKELNKIAFEIFEDSYEFHKIDPIELVKFTENITDYNVDKNLSYKILDALALHNDEEVLGLVLKEYRRRCVLFTVHLYEYPNLFYRRIYIPIRYSAQELLISIISSLRTSNYEECYLNIDGKKYSFNGDNLLSSISIFDLKYAIKMSVIYGIDHWCFDLKPIGLTYLNIEESSMPYLVEDGIGYGIEGMSKNRLFDMLDESIELSIDTHNPIMDDEDFEFYDSDTDSLNDNAKEDFEYTYNRYIKIS